MKLIAAFIAVCVLFPTITRADSGDESLKFFLSKSELVVLGEIKNEPIGINLELGVANYACSFQVLDVLNGDTKLKGEIIRVNIVRFELVEKDRHPLIKKNAECILFLNEQPKGNSPHWATADFWFGIEQPSPWMAKSLKRLAN